MDFYLELEKFCTPFILASFKTLKVFEGRKPTDS